IRGRDDLEIEEKMVAAEAHLGIIFTEDVIEGVLVTTPRTVDLMETAAVDVLSALQSEGVQPDQLEDFRRRVPEAVRTHEFTRPLTAFLSLVVQQRLQPNLFFNETATMEARREALASVDDRIIKRDEVIVYEGQRVTQDELTRLRDAGLLRDELRYPSIIGAALLAIVFIGLMGSYLYFFHRRIYDNESRLVLIGLVALATLLLGRVLWPISGFAIPVAAGTMLVAILVEPRVAAFLAVLIAAVVGIMADTGLNYSLVALIGGLVGVFSVTRVGQRSDLMRAGFHVALANGLVILAWALSYGVVPLFEVQVWRDVFWGVTGGILAAILTIGSLPFLESFFGILTPVKLVELANPNQPLLHRLLVEAPGSYHHSIMVANLAEAAAERVGGNSLLTRVAAYYHDIGKLRRPYFFIENQFGGENPHDKISANLSALIITAHVRDGVETAQQAGLPEELIRFIREHHGTSRVQYFYHKAMEETDGEGILEENFCYAGPVPESRETAILMLADSAEAAVRSLPRPTPGRIESTVRKLVRDRLNERQLDRCDLTLRDLDIIADTFVQVLTGIFHARIEYPESMLHELEQAGQRGDRSKLPGKSGGRSKLPGKSGGRDALPEKTKKERKEQKEQKEQKAGNGNDPGGDQVAKGPDAKNAGQASHEQDPRPPGDDHDRQGR
ncbi:MAG: HDIG domain-containing metalloprotein, partial [Thermaerobacterales bacterium]